MVYSQFPEETKEKMRAAHRKWAKKNPRTTYYQQYDEDRRGRRKEYIMLTNSKANAKKKGLAHTIKLEDIVIPETCPCCLDPIDRPSLDRVDNQRGYEPENIQVICNHCNSVKRDGTAELHRKIAEYMDKHTLLMLLRA